MRDAERERLNGWGLICPECGLYTDDLCPGHDSGHDSGWEDVDGWDERTEDRETGRITNEGRYYEEES